MPLSARAEKPCLRRSSAHAGFVHRRVWLFRDPTVYHCESTAMPFGLLRFLG
ncbi:hypothetical protein VTN02DRAFT_3009 [Thermoascus thermophilus]